MYLPKYVQTWGGVKQWNVTTLFMPIQLLYQTHIEKWGKLEDIRTQN